MGCDRSASARDGTLLRLEGEAAAPLDSARVIGRRSEQADQRRHL